jgi:hypothetical protein
MNLFATLPTPDYTAWKTTFDAHAEDRASAGLTLKQLWRDAHDPAQAVALFGVHNRAAAQVWLNAETTLSHIAAARFARIA